MTNMLAGRRRTDPERFDLYTRWSLYLLLGVVPFLALAVVSEVSAEAPAATAAYVIGMLVHTALAIAVTAKGVGSFLGGAPVGRGLLLALGVTTVALAVWAVTAVPADEGLLGRTGALGLTLGVSLLPVALRMNVAVLAVATVGVPALAVGVRQLDHVLGRAAGYGGSAVAIFIALALMVGGMVVSWRASVWMLGVVWEQERSRAVHARLAVAEERLRFSRDLHDVVGRTLSTVAVKSELAAELARRGRDGAADQMLEVRELAQDALREVREVVAGYRSADLAAELDGARSVLRSAGVATRVLGDGSALPQHVQQALAWVVREAVTNVVRHAHAEGCTIDLQVVVSGANEDLARLTISNDGVEPRRDRGTGSLVGLSERLAQVGGTLTTEADGDRFVLQATVPIAETPGIRPSGSSATMEPR